MTEYRIGTMLRQRYNDFLGLIYHPRDIYAVSTDIDRTKMSLQLMLAGLYPPHIMQLWNPDLLWLAIPIHYVPERVDMLLKSQNSPMLISWYIISINIKLINIIFSLFYLIDKYISNTNKDCYINISQK